MWTKAIHFSKTKQMKTIIPTSERIVLKPSNWKKHHVLENVVAGHKTGKQCKQSKRL